MNKIWFGIGLAGLVCTGLMGCGTKETTSSSIPASFSPSVQEAMKAYQDFNQTPLLVPTVVPTPSSKSASTKIASTANDPSYDKYNYLLRYMSTDASIPITEIAFVTGSKELPDEADSDVFVHFSQYSGPEVKMADTVASQFNTTMGHETLANGISVVTYLVTAKKSNDSSPPVTHVIWHEGKWTFEVSSLTKSINRPNSIADNVITHFDSSKLPTPWKNAYVEIQDTSGGLFKPRQIDTIVSWDESFGKIQGKYQIRTFPTCSNPIFTALNMASSIKVYSYK
ncbi:hypothetical protein [Alicyclobacillus acidoterrestris]|uniref:Uncharacterized protein n=1 Tax=Alicyclobacillus acidoterrestris (strain ATCC 49025 / DSM 3922 / CIP 106132 / NCIMB 13137 / GD3B) TaxID=1356854 RepID=T0CJA1_ALIAG|nr:hypothetical protein [Alicyclobacillus acidoterrestris]EPZ52570.1 hypothetical protein N007_20480 [Alicyclobacillus acidoterrestris ATCC 49025]UNO47277.1 hypothetical protein K1I37_11075 [Alicyclobacillus acidoterrestris]